MDQFKQVMDECLLAYDMGEYQEAKKRISLARKLLNQEETEDEKSYGQKKMQIVWVEQSIAGRVHDMDTYEALEGEFIQALAMFQTDPVERDFFYAVHLQDAIQLYVNDHQIPTAQILFERMMEIWNPICGESHFLNTVYHFLQAQIMFGAENYHGCLEHCSASLSELNEEPQLPEGSLERLVQYYNNEYDHDSAYVSTCLLCGQALEKIGDFEKGIELLECLLQDIQGSQYHNQITLINIDLTLCALYAQSGRMNQAKAIYLKYRNSNFAQYPDLQTAIYTLGIALEPDKEEHVNTKVSSLLHNTDISQDAQGQLLYNKACVAITNGEYNKALEMFQMSGDRGLPFQIITLAKMEKYQEIPMLLPQVNRYYHNQIEQMYLYYNEEYIYSHLSKLSLQFELVLNALLSTPRDILPAEKVYDFVLNTKAISLEATWLWNNYRNDREYRLPRYQVRDVQSELSGQTALLEYCLIKDLDNIPHYGVCIVTKETVEVIKLDEVKAIDENINKWFQLISAHGTTGMDAWKQVETALRQQLFLPMKEFLGECEVSRLCIAPVMGLANFPFARLSISSRKYLDDEYQIVYINAGKELLLQNKSDRAIDENPLILGISEFESLPQLPYVEQEVDMIAQILNTGYYLNEDVDFELLVPTLSEEPSMVHISSHGTFYQEEMDSENPDWDKMYRVMHQSGVRIGNEQLLCAADLSTIWIPNTTLFTLSACETGVNLTHGSEGSYGLRRALKIAGVGFIIATLWKVDDRACSLFMGWFYENCMNGEQIEEAFCHAVMRLRQYEECGVYPYENPYYWACFILQI